MQRKKAIISSKRVILPAGFGQDAPHNNQYRQKNPSLLQSYTVFKDKYPGSKAIILGTGTSLKDLDLSFIHRHVVICVNASILLVDWNSGEPDKRFWIAHDTHCRKWNYWLNVRKSKSFKIVKDNWTSYFRELGGFYVFSPRPTKALIDPNDEGLCSCSSIPSTIDFALQMGCSEVFLFGIDQYFSGSKRYFWQYWPKEEQPVFNGKMDAEERQKKIFLLNDESYKSLRQLADYKKARIYNCNPSSKVVAFDKIDYTTARLMIEND
jgi:hypothetical protein